MTLCIWNGVCSINIWDQEIKYSAELSLGVDFDGQVLRDLIQNTNTYGACLHPHESKLPQKVKNGNHYNPKTD